VQIIALRPAKPLPPRKPPAAGADQEYEEFFERFMANRAPSQPGRSIGAGVIISADGYVLTAEHLFNLEDAVSVRLHNGPVLAATIVGKDPRSGVALLKIPASNLAAAVPGDPKKLRLAERVFALGMQAAGRSGAVTDGIVSALDVENVGSPGAGYLQTTVTLYPYMGGGPLFNLAGQLVGINSMLYSRTSGSGLSFAIPIDDAMAIVQVLRTEGRVRRGTLGVAMQEVTPMIAATYGMDGPAGVMVAGVNPGGPAEKAGIQRGDLLMRFGGEPLRSMEHAIRYVARTKPGEPLVVRVRRLKDVREEDVTVTLAEATDK